MHKLDTGSLHSHKVDMGCTLTYLLRPLVVLFWGEGDMILYMSMSVYVCFSLSACARI